MKGPTIMIKKYFLGVLLLSLPGFASENATTSGKPSEDFQNLDAARKKGGTTWYYLCQQLSRTGREHGDIFLNRFSIEQNLFSLTRYCIVNGEPEYIPQLTAEVLNAHLADWNIAKTNKRLPKGRKFTFYSAKSRVLGLQPGYWRLSKKLIKLRRMLNENWELHRASIPTTISRFEQALDEIARSAGVEFSPVTDYQSCFEKRQKRADERDSERKVFISEDKLNYRIDNQSVIDQKKLPRTHRIVYWTPIQESTALACLPKKKSDEFLETLENSINSKLQLENAESPAAVSPATDAQ